MVGVSYWEVKFKSLMLMMPCSKIPELKSAWNFGAAASGIPGIYFCTSNTDQTSLQQLEALASSPIVSVSVALFSFSVEGIK
jgi:hypothetical protein